VRRVLARDSDAQIEPFGDPTKGKAQTAGQGACLLGLSPDIQGARF
jgi:hypothetical protein